MTGRPDRDRALQQLIDAALAQLRQGWQRLTAAQDAVLRALAAARRRPARPRAVPPTVRTALAAFASATARFHTDLGALAERWTAQDLPRAYRVGAEDALHHAVLGTDAGRPGFSWSSAHQSALRTLTRACYAVLIDRISDTVRRAHAFVRAVTAAARAATPPAADDLAARHRLDTVTYAQGARHPATAWAQSVLAAQGVTAANTGALATTTADLEARWVQVADGPECGWTSHHDPDLADGTLRSATSAAVHPIAHPACRRRFTPRPDLNHASVQEGQPL